jgi:hypothetical protein
MREEIKKQIEWEISSGRFKDINELIEEAKAQFNLFGGGGWYGIKFYELIPMIEEEYNTN